MALGVWEAVSGHGRSGRNGARRGRAPRTNSAHSVARAFPPARSPALRIRRLGLGRSLGTCWVTVCAREGPFPMEVQTVAWYLDDKVALGVSGHFAEFEDQLTELWATVCIYHPAWGRKEEKRYN